jgi:hypothetical protein
MFIGGQSIFDTKKVMESIRPKFGIQMSTSQERTKTIAKSLVCTAVQTSVLCALLAYTDLPLWDSGVS